MVAFRDSTMITKLTEILAASVRQRTHGNPEPQQMARPTPIAEFEASRILGLELTEARTAG